MDHQRDDRHQHLAGVRPVSDILSDARALQAEHGGRAVAAAARGIRGSVAGLVAGFRAGFRAGATDGAVTFRRLVLH